jgi:hypothetical protein
LVNCPIYFSRDELLLKSGIWVFAFQYPLSEIALHQSQFSRRHIAQMNGLRNLGATKLDLSLNFA